MNIASSSITAENEKQVYKFINQLQVPIMVISLWFDIIHCTLQVG
jgi:hypothetical protein